MTVRPEETLRVKLSNNEVLLAILTEAEKDKIWFETPWNAEEEPSAKDLKHLFAEVIAAYNISEEDVAKEDIAVDYIMQHKTLWRIFKVLFNSWLVYKEYDISDVISPEDRTIFQNLVRAFYWNLYRDTEHLTDVFGVEL